MLKENCIICLQPITNPVCIDCYLRQIKAWLDYVDMTIISKDNLMKKIKTAVLDDGLNETECIICGKGNLSICSYCFFLQVAGVFRDLNFDNEFIESFLAVFNYNFSEEKESMDEIEH